MDFRTKVLERAIRPMLHRWCGTFSAVIPIPMPYYAAAASLRLHSYTE